MDAGASHLISQLFYDNADYLRFLDKARAAGIDVPIEAGIMPVTNAASVRRMTGMCSSKVPERLATILDRWGDDPNTLKEAGIIYASEQIADLVARGVDGIMCSSKVPERLATILDRWGDDPNTLKEAGIIYASEQIADLVARGVDGIHLYTMNHPGVTRRIWQNVQGLF